MTAPLGQAGFATLAAILPAPPGPVPPSRRRTIHSAWGATGARRAARPQPRPAGGADRAAAVGPRRSSTAFSEGLEGAYRPLPRGIGRPSPASPAPTTTTRSFMISRLFVMGPEGAWGQGPAAPWRAAPGARRPVERAW